MAINLKKGQRIDIGLTNLSIGLGWTPNEGNGLAFDLDASAFLLNERKEIPTERHFIFFNNTSSPEGSLIHSGDDTSGISSAGGDDETIVADLTLLSPDIVEIVFIVTIYDALNRRQNFGKVRDSYIRIVDTLSSQEIARYELGEDFSIETGIEFGRLYKRDGKWRFEASGIGYKEDLAFFVSRYFKGIIQK